MKRLNYNKDVAVRWIAFSFFLLNFSCGSKKAIVTIKEIKTYELGGYYQRVKLTKRNTPEPSSYYYLYFYNSKRVRGFMVSDVSSCKLIKNESIKPTFDTIYDYVNGKVSFCYDGYESLSDIPYTYCFSGVFKEDTIKLEVSVKNSPESKFEKSPMKIFVKCK
jgi:hypothetical protein